MFAVKISQYYRNLCDIYPVLRKMVEFDSRENDFSDLELLDPIGDQTENNKVSDIATHRYPDRMLILTTLECASYCRFCFRKRIVGSKSENASTDKLTESLKYIRKTPQIKEIILSGGDTLTIEPKLLLWFLKEIKSIDTIRTIRIHTRVPVYAPDLVYNYGDCINYVDTIIVHVNHPYEITGEFKDAIKFIRKDTLICNQSVLLKGINDSAEIISELSYSLVQAGVVPYYLHYLDLAQGVSHFRTSLKESIHIVQSLRGRLPGYMIPKLILDIPCGKGKIVLEEQMFRFISDTEIMVRSPLNGEEYYYKELIS